MNRLLSILTALVLLVLATTPCLALEWGAKELETEKLAIAFASDVAKGGYTIVGTEELKSWIDAKKPLLIVDTMPFEASFKKNHIPGAVNFELPIPEMTSMDAAQQAAFEKLLGPDKNRQLVFYCGFTKCTRSHNGALWAKKLGYTNVVRHPGGIKAWLESDFPVEKSE